MRKRKVLFICLFTLMGLILFVGILPNYSCIKEILVQNKFQKNNGRLLLYGIASTFDTWGDNLDTSTGFKISKKCIDNLGHIDSEEFYKNIDNASKSNLIINKTNLKNSIFINQCIFLRDIKVLYITYNALFPNHNKVFKASLIVAANLYCPKTDGVNCPQFDGLGVKKTWEGENQDNSPWTTLFTIWSSIILCPFLAP